MDAFLDFPGRTSEDHSVENVLDCIGYVFRLGVNNNNIADIVLRVYSNLYILCITEGIGIVRC